MLSTEVIIMGVVGLAIGWFLPDAYRQIVEYKCKQKKRELPKFNLALWHRILSGAVNMFLYGLIIYHAHGFVLGLTASLLISMAILFTLIDLKIRLIPNELLLVLLGIGLVYRLTLAGIDGILPSLMGGFAMFMLFAISAKVAGFNKVGAGDLKLGFAVGFVCSSTSLTVALLVMAATMGFITLGGMLIGKLKRTDMIPFAGFIMAGMAAGILNSLKII